MKKSLLFGVVCALCLFITACFFCVGALRSPVPVFAVEGGLSVVLDAGHGGIDGGVSGRKTGVKESEINLAIAFRLNDVLTEMGFEVTMTRKTDAGLYGTTAPGFKKRDMQRRKEIIQDASPMLVISVHQNFYPSQRDAARRCFTRKTMKRADFLRLPCRGK